MLNLNVVLLFPSDPVTPGVSQYVIGSPLFEKVTMSLQNGNTFKINTVNNNYQNHYIRSLKLNGTNYNKTWIDYNDIQKGGSLNFEMDSKPNKEFGISSASRPFSFTKDK